MHRGLTLPAFLAHRDAVRFERRSPNTGYLYAHAVLRIDGEPFVVQLGFEQDRLATVRLIADDPRFGTSWDDADPDAQRRFHDDWLRERLGRGRFWQRGSFPLGGVEYDYDWGSVGSYLHPQDMSPVILVTYGSGGQAGWW